MHYPTIYTGTIIPYEGSKPSAIGKRQVSGGVMLNRLGLEGDEQAEKKSMAAPIGRCVSIRVSIISFGNGSIPSKLSNFVLRP